MNLLREYIRELLTESAFGLSEFEKRGYYIAIEDTGDGFEIKLYDFDPGSTSKPGSKWVSAEFPDGALGLISAMAATGNEMGECSGAYTVTWVSVSESGWGPFLYDIAMEWATMKGTGLAPDRGNVSYEANNIWDYYLSSRDDVEEVQLDDLEDHLTPGDKNDNCAQTLAYERGLEGGTFWDEDNEETPWDPYGKDVLLRSPLSKMYRKKGIPTIEALSKMGRWVEL